MEQVPFSLSLYIGENLIIMILSNDDNDGVSGDDDDVDDRTAQWIKTNGSSAALIDFKADRWEAQLGCG